MYCVAYRDDSLKFQMVKFIKGEPKVSIQVYYILLYTYFWSTL